MPQPNHFPVFENTQEHALPVDPFKALLARLTQAFGPSGSEDAVRSLIRDECRSLADEVRVDGLGNLIVRKRGAGGGVRKKVMLAAHMDESGLIVTHVDQKGFARFASLGPTENLALLGQRCLFANGTVGVIGREEKRSKSKELEYERLFIDTGASETGSRIGVGDVATFVGPFVDAGARVMSKALDNRVGCAILIETLRGLKKTPHELHMVFTVQHQVGARGATTSTFGIQPDIALAVDVTSAGDTPDPETNSVTLGKGPAIKVKDPGVLASPAVRDALVESARDAKLAYQFEVALHGSSDTGAMQIAREGTQAGAVSIPLRYMHTPSEMIDVGDAQNAVKLLLAFLARPLQMNVQ